MWRWTFGWSLTKGLVGVEVDVWLVPGQGPSDVEVEFCLVPGQGPFDMEVEFCLVPGQAPLVWRWMFG